jgi:tetratricopeptide (TPR) repeat protein
MGILMMVSGCTSVPSPAPTPASWPELTQANQSLQAGQADNAIGYARVALQEQPAGPMAAQAWYVEGRGYELKIASDPSDMEQNLFEATSCYQQALGQSPPPALEGDIRASLSNVLFFQDEFAEAIQQATVAIPLVSDSKVKGSLLYRIGLCQQRLSRFTEADQTFRQVEQRYPNTPIAEAAHEHEGQTRFYIQIASFHTQELADKAMRSLQVQGIIISQRTNEKGDTIIDDGPFANYSDAKKIRDQLVKDYPYAMVVP